MLDMGCKTAAAEAAWSSSMGIRSCGDAVFEDARTLGGNDWALPAWASSRIFKRNSSLSFVFRETISLALTVVPGTRAATNSGCAAFGLIPVVCA